MKDDTALREHYRKIFEEVFKPKKQPRSLNLRVSQKPASAPPVDKDADHKS